MVMLIYFGSLPAGCIINLHAILGPCDYRSVWLVRGSGRPIMNEDTYIGRESTSWVSLEMKKSVDIVIGRVSDSNTHTPDLGRLMLCPSIAASSDVFNRLCQEGNAGFHREFASAAAQ
jgi:hypothetical protein